MLSLQDPWGDSAAWRGRRVLLAMSGGVDSSAAAVLLQRAGAVVTGITMKNFCWSETATTTTSCCSLHHQQDARQVCDRLGITHYVLDVTRDFAARVMDRFVAEYDAGRTPNPCVDCNQAVRFPQLVQQADRLDCEWIATGHYVRAGRGADGRTFFLRARDAAKDQSYFLHGVAAEIRARCVFPLGDLHKDEVRAVAREAGLAVAAKPESQEVCFLADGDRTGFLASRSAPRPGNVVDTAGRKLGAHAGIGGFTIGQRRGLGIAAAQPLYVTALDAATATVVVGEESQLYARGLEVDGFWLDATPDELSVQVRYRHPPVAVAALAVDGPRATIRFAAPERAVAPGQAAVLYAGDVVVGGGRIVASQA
jgi:tRNA-specific 2-thiouridylase